MFNINWSTFGELTLGEIAELERLAEGTEPGTAAGPSHQPEQRPGITYERQ